MNEMGGEGGIQLKEEKRGRRKNRKKVKSEKKNENDIHIPICLL